MRNAYKKLYKNIFIVKRYFNVLPLFPQQEGKPLTISKQNKITSPNDHNVVLIISTYFLLPRINMKGEQNPRGSMSFEPYWTLESGC